MIDFRLVARQRGDFEIAGVAQRRENRAAQIAALLQQHRGRQIAWRRVDGVTEQHELHERDHDDHGEGNTVALELDEFLHQHRPALAPESSAAQARRRLRGHHMRHWKLSFALLIRSMNTSSSDASECFHCSPAWLRYGAMADSSLAASRPETCRLVP